MIEEDKYNPLLSERDIEHNTYLRVKYEYMEMKEKREKVNRIGIIFIAVSAIVFLALMVDIGFSIVYIVEAFQMIPTMLGLFTMGGPFGYW